MHHLTIAFLASIVFIYRLIDVLRKRKNRKLELSPVNSAASDVKVGVAYQVKRARKKGV